VAPRCVTLFVVLAAVAMAGCGEDRPSERAETAQVSPGEDMSALGACFEEGEVDFAPADAFLGHTAEWVEVDLAVAAESRSIADVPRATTSDVALPVTLVGANGEAASSQAETRTLRMHGSLLESVDWASGNPGSKVYLGVGDADYAGQVLFSLVVDSSGRFAFGGHCASRSLTRPVTDDLETRGTSIQELLGATGQDIPELLNGPAEPSDENPPVLLHPGNVDQELLNSLSLVVVDVDVPDSWAAPATLCTHIEEGWNDCLPLDGSLSFPRAVTAFVGSSSALEFWLLDEDANLERPLQQLETIQVPNDVLQGQDPRLTVRLEGTLSADGSEVDEPSVSLVGD
jgi:hypothetical protein